MINIVSENNFVPLFAGQKGDLEAMDRNSYRNKVIIVCIPMMNVIYDPIQLLDCYSGFPPSESPWIGCFWRTALAMH